MSLRLTRSSIGGASPVVQSDVSRPVSGRPSMSMSAHVTRPVKAAMDMKKRIASGVQNEFLFDCNCRVWLRRSMPCSRRKHNQTKEICTEREVEAKLRFADSEEDPTRRLHRPILDQSSSFLYVAASFGS